MKPWINKSNKLLFIIK